jgi:hypothetical protein
MTKYERAAERIDAECERALVMGKRFTKADMAAILAEEFPEPFLTARHGEMLREMDAMLLPDPDGRSWRIESPDPSSLEIDHNAGRAVESIYADFKEARP